MALEADKAQVTITVLGRKECGFCVEAKKKLRIMGLPFTERTIDEAIALHDGWRTDGTVGIRAVLAANDDHPPVILVDGKAYGYAGAMRELKQRNAVTTEVRSPDG